MRKQLLAFLFMLLINLIESSNLRNLVTTKDGETVINYKNNLNINTHKKCFK